MDKKKRLLCSLLLCLSLVVTALMPGMTARAADSDFVVSDGVLTRYNGAGGAVTIPSSVTSIGEYAFFERSDITSITIPKSVTSIGDYAFWSCMGLTSVTIPKGVTTIGSFAFYDCENLAKVSLPTTLTSIGTYAFSDCESLKTITIPKKVTEIHAGAFENCTSLTKITVNSTKCTFTSSNADNDDSGNIFFNNFDSDNQPDTISKAVTIKAYSGSTGQTFAEDEAQSKLCARTIKYEILNDTLDNVKVSTSLNITAGKTKTIKVTLPSSVKKVTKFTKKSGQVTVSYKLKSTGDATLDKAITVNKSGKVSLKNYKALKKGTTFSITTTVKTPNGDAKKFTTKFTVKK